DCAYEIRFTAHHVQSPELGNSFGVTACERRLETRVLMTNTGDAIVASELPATLSRAYGGRLWLRVGCFNCGDSSVAAPVSLSRLEISKLSNYAVVLRRVDRVIDRVGKWTQLNVDRVIEGTRKWAQARGSELKFLKTQVLQRGAQIKSVLNIVRSDPVGSLPRIWRRLARLARLPHQ